MDHDEVIEALELAAAEPGGLERLTAGDTTAAMAIAAHLAGCPSCRAELDRLRVVRAVARDLVAEPAAGAAIGGAERAPADLRARTLAYVREHGQERSQVSGAPVSPSVAVTRPAAVPPASPARPIAFPVRRPIVGWVAAVAAAVVISVASTSFLVNGAFDARFRAQDEAISDLASVTTATLHVTAQADAARVNLASPTGAPITGTLLYSPTTTELVVVATGLTEPAAGMEYRCWVDTGSGRQAIGRMFFGGGLAYWVGPSGVVAGLSQGATFGVSLVDASGASSGPDPVLKGA